MNSGAAGLGNMVRVVGLEKQRMDRNRLKSKAGDRINVISSAGGMNLAKLLKWADVFLRLIFNWLFSCQITLLVLPIK